MPSAAAEIPEPRACFLGVERSLGGTDGTLISNQIAYHMQSSLNWGLAGALGAILLASVLAFYLIYNKIVGIDNMSLG